MVIARSEIFGKDSEKVRKAVAKAEKIIDKELSARGTNTFDVNLFDNDKIVLEEIVSLYKLAGWKVRIVHDQRDGDYLKFE